MAQIIFETFGAKNYTSYPGLTLQLYASGKTSGIVYDFGHKRTQISGILEGYLVKPMTKSYRFGSFDLENQLFSLFQKKGISFENFENYNFILNDIKNKSCFVAPDYPSFLDLMKKKEQPSKYELPDGNIIELGK